MGASNDGGRDHFKRRGGDAIGRQQRAPAVSRGVGRRGVEIRKTFATARGLSVDSDKIIDMSGAEATEERFRELAPQCYLLHLSTHGFFAAENLTAAKQASEGGTLSRGDESLGFSPGMLSGLVLSGANLGPGEPDQQGHMPDDGFLTADEIAVLPLGKAQLVVLSACDTALGKAEGGEGVLGVQRAFQVAGAGATIASLWKVNDQATMWIMMEFYNQYLKGGKPPLEALRDASSKQLQTRTCRAAPSSRRSGMPPRRNCRRGIGRHSRSPARGSKPGKLCGRCRCAAVWI